MSRCALAVVTILLIGCGQAVKESWRDVELASVEEGSPAAGVGETQDTSVGTALPVVRDRKIIYEADVTLIVKDFAKLERDVPALVKSHSGYLAEVEVDRTHGRFLTGRWVVRVPVEQYEAFLDSLSELGVPETFNQTAQDVTEEYVDLEARIANKKRLEERILDLLESSEGEIKDVIEVERELARVRSEVEQMEGRLRYLQNRTALTTVTIRGIERQDYVPPQAPSFLGRIGQAWETSLISLRRFGEGLTVTVVFLFPWLVLLVVVVAPVTWCVRRYSRRAASRSRRNES